MKRRFKRYTPPEFKDVFDFLDHNRDHVTINGERHTVRSLNPKERIKGVAWPDDWAVAVFDPKDDRLVEVLTLTEFRQKFISGLPNGASTTD